MEREKGVGLKGLYGEVWCWWDGAWNINIFVVGRMHYVSGRYVSSGKMRVMAACNS